MSLGNLYIVATPIGNLDDISARALDVLKSVALIAAEDTRKTGRLLKHFGIKTPLISYYEHNEVRRATEILELLGEGKDVAVVSEAGTPTVSDPGYRLISSAVKLGLKLIPIPGPSATIAALSVSGLPTDMFLFVGFLPDKDGKRRSKLEGLKDFSSTLIFYISKWKIGKTLSDILDIFGDRRVCYCRELTKLHEEIVHTTVGELQKHIQKAEVLGEITLVVEGSQQ